MQQSIIRDWQGNIVALDPPADPNDTPVPAAPPADDAPPAEAPPPRRPLPDLSSPAAPGAAAALTPRQQQTITIAMAVVIALAVLWFGVRAFSAPPPPAMPTPAPSVAPPAPAILAYAAPGGTTLGPLDPAALGGAVPVARFGADWVQLAVRGSGLVWVRRELSGVAPADFAALPDLAPPPTATAAPPRPPVAAPAPAPASAPVFAPPPAPTEVLEQCVAALGGQWCAPTLDEAMTKMRAATGVRPLEIVTPTAVVP